MSWSMHEHRTAPLPPSLACRFDPPSSFHTQAVNDTHLQPSTWPMNATTVNVEDPFSNGYTHQVAATPPKQPSRADEVSTQMTRAALCPTTTTNVSCVDDNTSCEKPPWCRLPLTSPPSYQSHIPPSLRQSQVIYRPQSISGSRDVAIPSPLAPSSMGGEPRGVLNTKTQKRCCDDICVAMQGVRDSMLRQTSVLQAQSELQQSFLHTALQAQENFDRVLVEFKEELRSTREALVLLLSNRSQPDTRESPRGGAVVNTIKTLPNDKDCPEKVYNENRIGGAQRKQRNAGSFHTNTVTLLGATLSNQSYSSANTPLEAAALRNESCSTHRAGSLECDNLLSVRTKVISFGKRRIIMAKDKDDDREATGNEFRCKKKHQRQNIESEPPAATHLSSSDAADDEETADPEEDVFFM